MATQSYASSHLKVLDEKYFTKAKTAMIISKGVRVEFEGKNAVTIYSVDTVEETDYIRSGTSRFGQLIELGTGEQTFTLSQDKAFTFSVDQGNLEDSMMVQEAHQAVKRQVRQVSVPNTDKYRLATLMAYAVTNTQGATNSITASDAYQKFLVQNGALDNAEVDEDGRVAYVTPDFYNLLKRDQEFIKDCDTSAKDLKTGVLGEVDGVKIVKVPASYLPTYTYFMIVSDKVLVSPTKFDMVRVLTEQRGIHGAVAEGRRYYDAFIPKNKGVAIRYHKSA